MRFQFQCFLGNVARLQAHDAAGLNPVVLARWTGISPAVTPVTVSWSPRPDSST